MTDSSLLSAQHALPLDPIIPQVAAPPPPSPPILTNGHITEEVDGEDYEIDCICGFKDDDGSTVECEKCGTWQHVACYYQGKPPPGDKDSHYCVRCVPRTDINVEGAIQLQRNFRHVSPVEAERKPKKPGPKPKKKAKNESSAQINGWTNGNGAVRNGAESNGKRPKARHQSSTSIVTGTPKLSGQATKRTPSGNEMVPIKSPISPLATSDPNEVFSPDFMDLYDNDAGRASANVNEFDDISLTMLLGDWARDEGQLAQATNGKQMSEIFLRDPPSEMQPFVVKKHNKSDKSIVAHGKHPRWIYLTVESFVPKGEFVGKLFGKIGDMKQYAEDSANRWEYLCHPLPFVFFHPHLPIIIDTRDEGSVFRYLRRSCNPNLMMRTWLEEGFDYQFVFTATEDIEEGTELSIPWTFDEHCRRHFSKGPEVDAEYVAEWARKVLAEFGGCACNDPSNCSLAKYASLGRDMNNHPKRSKSRKKAPRGVGSRSGSEAFMQADEDDLDDGTGTSTSSRSKPQSRDGTPSSMVDAKNILGEPISEREKRKIALLEKNEQEKQLLPDKKKQKRKSADPRQGTQSNQNMTPGPGRRGPALDPHANDSVSPVNDTGIRPPPQTSLSPFPAANAYSPTAMKPTYADSSCQADLDSRSPPRAMPSPTRILPRRSKNALHRHVFRKSILKTESTSPQGSPTLAVKPEMDYVGFKPDVQSPASPQMKDSEGDALMTGGTAISPDMKSFPTYPHNTLHKPRPDEKAEVDETVKKISEGLQLTADLPQKIKTEKSPTPTNVTEQTVETHRKVDLHLDMPPPSSTFHRQASSPGIVSTPDAIAAPEPSALTVPPTSQAAEPSPSSSRKTISLTDYLRRKSSTQNVSTASQGTETPTSESDKTLSTVQEQAKQQPVEGTALETPQAGSGDAMVQ